MEMSSTKKIKRFVVKKNLAAPQTVKRSQNHPEFQVGSLNCPVQLCQLFRFIRLCLERFFARALHLIGGIACDEVRFEGVLQRFTDVRMAMDDRVRADEIDVHFVRIVILDLLCGDLPQ